MDTLKTAKHSTRFSQIVLETYGHEGTFEIRVEADEPIEEIARDLRLLGCEVMVIPDRLLLTITVPEGWAKKKKR